ncbi:MAG: phage adaptor protein, partial [Alphaproteobacteria bacterium]
MAYSTYMEIVNSIMDEIDEDPLSQSDFDDPPTAEGRRVKNYVNFAYNKVVQGKPDWSWLEFSQTFNTVANQKAYTVGTELDSTTDLSSLPTMNSADDPSMEILSYSEFKRKYAEYEGNTTGKPYIAYVHEGKLYLYPTPDQVYSIELFTQKKHTALSAYNDTPLIPIESRDVLYYGALYRATSKEFEQRRQEVLADFRQRLQDLRNNDDKNHKGHA